MNEDTVNLLKECNAGCKMGLKTLEELVDRTENEKMKKQIHDSIEKHREMQDKTHIELLDMGESDKEPSGMAEAMSFLKTRFKLTLDSSDSEIAELLIDGCNMGIKSVSRYLNKYKAADKNVKDGVEELIKCEQKLMDELRFYLN